jgi:hypothetical protein
MTTQSEQEILTKCLICGARNYRMSTTEEREIHLVTKHKFDHILYSQTLRNGMERADLTRYVIMTGFKAVEGYFD